MADPHNIPPEHQETFEKIMESVAEALGGSSQTEEYSLMVQSATRVDALDEQIKTLQKEKARECSFLLPMLHKHAGGAITLSNGHTVLACTSAEKRPRRREMESHFGKEAVAAFWSTIEAKIRHYVSVKRPPATGAESEPAEESEPASS